MAVSGVHKVIIVSIGDDKLTVSTIGGISGSKPQVPLLNPPSASPAHVLNGLQIER